MTRRTWTTAEQRTWLHARIADFLESRQTNKLSEWWPKTYQAWFDEWPLEEPTPEQVAEAGGDKEKAVRELREAKEDQVYWWYINKTRGNASGSTKRGVLPLGQKKRKMHLSQAYLKLNKDRLMPEINRRWEEMGGDKADAKQKLAFIGKCAQEMMNDEPEEVLKEAELFRENGVLPNGPVDVESQEVRELRAKQQAIDNIPRTLAVCLDDLKRLTGWCGSIIVGGPDPRTGTFKNVTYHVGTTLNAGCTFPNNSNAWGDVEQAFGKFIAKCYRPDEEKRLHTVYTENSSRQGTPAIDSRQGSVAPQQPREDRTDVPPDSSGAGSSDVPDIEKERERNIQRNRELLASLQLDQPVGQAKQKPRPRPRPAHKGTSKVTSTPPPSTRQLRGRQGDAPEETTNGPSSSTLAPSASDASPQPPQSEKDGDLVVHPSTSSSSAPAPSPSTPAPSPSTPAPTSPPSAANPAPPPTPAPPPLSTPTPAPPSSTSVPASSLPASALAQSESTSATATQALNRDDLPVWWGEALTHLRSVSDDTEWQAVCNSWIEHETRLRFPDGSKDNRVATSGRPDEVHWWLKRNRRYDVLPPITSAKRYGESWKAWWRKLQPEWRGEEWPPSQVQPAESAVSWDTLDRGGCNGIFTVVMALSWWWSSVVVSGESMDDVRVAARDVQWVMGMMAQVLGKRPSDSAELGSSPKRRKA